MIRSWSIEDLPGISLERAPTDLDLFQNEGRLKSKKFSLNCKVIVAFTFIHIEREFFLDRHQRKRKNVGNGCILLGGRGGESPFNK